MKYGYRLPWDRELQKSVLRFYNTKPENTKNLVQLTNHSKTREKWAKLIGQLAFSKNRDKAIRLYYPDSITETGWILQYLEFCPKCPERTKVVKALILEDVPEEDVRALFIEWM